MHKLGPNGKAKEFVKYIMNIITCVWEDTAYNL